MGAFSKNAALLALGLWLGCAIFFGAVAAPTIFNPDVAGGVDRGVLGAISGAMLRRVYFITYITIGIATFFLLIASIGESKGAKGTRWALVLCLLVLGINAISDLWIANKLNKLKMGMTNSHSSEATALKMEFDSWHARATWIYQAAVLCGGLGAILLLPAGTAAKGKKSSK